MTLHNETRIGWRHHSELWRDISPTAQSLVKPIIAIGLRKGKTVETQLIKHAPYLFDQRFNGLCARLGETTKSAFWNYKTEFDLVCSRMSRNRFADREVLYQLQNAIDISLQRYNRWKRNGVVTLDYYDVNADLPMVTLQ